METLLDLYAVPWTALIRLEPWLSNLIVAMILFAKISFAGWMLAKAGRGPVWALLALVPWTEVIALWAFAYARWPGVDEATRGS